MQGEFKNLREKTDEFVHLLRSFCDPPEPELHDSPHTRYRMRMEFRVWHEGGDLFYVMFKPGSKERYRVDESPLVCETIHRLMPAVLEEARRDTQLSKRLFQIEFLANQRGDCLVTLIYHRPLDENWQTAARGCAERLGVQIVGRSRKQRMVLDRDWIDEEIEVAGKPYRYRQIENGFTQPNAVANAQMLNWVVREVGKRNEPNEATDFLELYCGLGNFTIPVAGLFRKVLVTEVSRTSIRALEHNLEANDVTNVQHARMSAEELSQALSGVRKFNRLRHVNLEDYAFSTMLVDPPRSGVDETTLGLMGQFDTLLYISCNPQTFARDAEALQQSHDVASLSAYNQFPGTKHLEVSARFERQK